MEMDGVEYISSQRLIRYSWISHMEVFRDAWKFLEMHMFLIFIDLILLIFSSGYWVCKLLTTLRFQKDFFGVSGPFAAPLCLGSLEFAM